MSNKINYGKGRMNCCLGCEPPTRYQYIDDDGTVHNCHSTCGKYLRECEDKQEILDKTYQYKKQQDDLFYCINRMAKTRRRKKEQ